jgi:hypothetical protein
MVGNQLFKKVGGTVQPVRAAEARLLTEAFNTAVGICFVAGTPILVPDDGVAEALIGGSVNCEARKAQPWLLCSIVLATGALAFQHHLLKPQKKRRGPADRRRYVPPVAGPADEIALNKQVITV